MTMGFKFDLIHHNLGVPKIFTFIKFSVWALEPEICILNLFGRFSHNWMVTEWHHFGKVVLTFWDLSMLFLCLWATRSFGGPTKMPQTATFLIDQKHRLWTKQKSPLQISFPFQIELQNIELSIFFWGFWSKYSMLTKKWQDVFKSLRIHFIKYKSLQFVILLQYWSFYVRAELLVNNILLSSCSQISSSSPAGF